MNIIPVSSTKTSYPISRINTKNEYKNFLNRPTFKGVPSPDFNTGLLYCSAQNRKILSSLFENIQDKENIEVNAQQQRTLSLYFNSIPEWDPDYESTIRTLKSGPVLIMKKTADKKAATRVYPLTAKEDYGKDPQILGLQYRYGNLSEEERTKQFGAFTRLGRAKAGKKIDISLDKLNFQMPSVKGRALKILFLSLYPGERKDIFQSVGPNYIEAYLKNNSEKNSIDTLHLETVLDDEETIKEKIKKYSPDIIGISTKTNSHVQFNKWMDFLEKNYNSTPKIIGGQLANSSYPEILEQYPDTIVMFDNGEVPTKMLTDIFTGKTAPQNLGKIPNLAFMYDNEMQLTEFKDFNCIVEENPIPSDSNIKEVIERDGIISVRLSQGCWGNCTFCTLPGKWHGTKIDNIIQVLQEWKNKYNLTSVFFTDDEVTNKDPKEAYSRLEELADKLAQADLGITWTTDLRADCISWIDDKLMEKLKKSGCVSVFLGIESGSDTQLKRYGKPVKGVEVSADVNKRAIEFFKHHNIKLGIGWIPFDPLMPTLRELKENIKFIEDNDLLSQNIRLDTSMRLQRGAQYGMTLGKYNIGLLGELQPNMFHYDGKYLDPRVGTIRDHIHKWTNDIQSFDDKINAIKFKLACEPSKAPKYKAQLEIGNEVQRLTLDYLKTLISVFEETEEDKQLDKIASGDRQESLEASRLSKNREFMLERRNNLIRIVNLKKEQLFSITQQYENERDKLIARFYES